MSSQNKQSPFSQFTRVAGRYNSLAPFLIMSGKQQVFTGNNDIDLNCYHTRMYTTDNSITGRLSNGIQDGQLKKLTFAFKGSESANIVIECPALTDTYSQISFTQVGDFAFLMWTGGSWTVIETGNMTDPGSNTPVVE